MSFEAAEFFGSALHTFWTSGARGVPEVEGLVVFAILRATDADINPLVTWARARKANVALAKWSAQLAGCLLGAWAARLLLGPEATCFDSLLIGASKTAGTEAAATFSVVAAAALGDPLAYAAAAAAVTAVAGKLTGAATSPTRFLAVQLLGRCGDAWTRGGAYLGGQVAGAALAALVLCFVT